MEAFSAELVAQSICSLCVLCAAALVFRHVLPKSLITCPNNTHPDRKADRKAAWDRASEEVKEILQAWMKQHPGEVVPDSVLAKCAAKICQVAPIDVKAGDENKYAVAFARYVLKDLLRTKGPTPVQRTVEEWRQLFPRYPSAENGYMKCYEPSDAEGIRHTLSYYGLCVVRVLDPEVCDASVVAMFEEVNARRAKKGIDGPKIDPEDFSTWFTGNWPSGSKFLLDEVALHQQAFANRCCRSIHETFASVFGERRLHVSVDNWGVHRGAKDNYKWSVGLKPHWDLNPWRYVEDFKEGFDSGYQGLVALTDQNLETGCHMTLPGFTRFAPQWCRERRLDDVWKSRRSHRADDDDPILPFMQPIPLRKGEMVIWSWGQLHGSCGSSSQRMRLQQYIRMYPAPESGNRRYEEHDRYACGRVLRRCLKKGELQEQDLESFASEAFQRCVLGLEAWPSCGL